MTPILRPDDLTLRRGGLRSERIRYTLDRARFGGLASAPASRSIGDLQWRPAQSGSIARDDQRRTWHSGNVSAVISNGHAVVAGAQTGGVWVINPIVGPTYRDGYRATSLSDNWTTPNVRSLAFGPDGAQHVYAGVGRADCLFLLEFDIVMGGLYPKQTDVKIPLPSTMSVYAIVVLENPRRVVIGSDEGIFWSEVPASVLDVGSYLWQSAAGLGDHSCAALVRSVGTSLAAAVSEPVDLFSSSLADPSPDVLMVGDWQGGTLTFAPAVVSPSGLSGFAFVLASCAAAPERIYGVAIGDEAAIGCVVRSDDGGRNWRAMTIPPGAGEQGYHNRAIAVSAYRPDVVAIGWQAAGPFLSTDGAQTWTLLSGGTGADEHGMPCHSTPQAVHADTQDLHFPRNALQTDVLIVSSDGGVTATSNQGRCFDGEYNRGLAVLQFYGPEHGSAVGTLSVSSRFHGVLSGGTQDNGNITLHPDADAGSVWHRLVGGDGGITRFVDPLAALLHVNNGEPHVRMATWNDAERRFNGAGSVIPKDGDAAGLEPTALEAVVVPTWRRQGQRLYACAGSSNGDVHGLFVDDRGTNAAFVRIATLPKPVTAVASLNGSEILAGLSDGRIVSIDAASQAWTEQAQDTTPPISSPVTRFEYVASTLMAMPIVYALKRSKYAPGRLLRSTGGTWTALPAAGDWVIFTADLSSGRLFAASATDVFSSDDGGQSWKDASLGLPVTPYCTDLRIGADADGGSTLYLTTYGRSVWKATITLPPDKGPDLELPPLAREILFGVIQDGGGVIRVGGRLVKIPPRQPASDLLAGLAIDQIAQTMSPESAREIRRTTLQQMSSVIARAIQSIG